ncbi:MAG: phenylalanine--tRNA ligase subunit beta [Limnochordaceae bacterium]|nr:phenylalanine--tRNA ligase subunit beta [Limnochordaceae bacterium]
MLVSLRWLRDYVDVPWTPAELAERLTSIGLEVKEMRELKPRFSGVVVGQVQELYRHPQADHLWIARVLVGEPGAAAKTVTLVTGATNLSVGDKVPVALPGAQLWGGATGEECVTIGPHEFVGVRSEGMLCSEAELQVGEDAGGIMILPSDVAIGQPLAEALALEDTILDLEIYANRADLTSVIGVAREVSALTGNPLRRPPLHLTVAGAGTSSAARPAPLPVAVDVQVQDPDLCPRYLATLALNVRVGPSPAWLASRLRAVGVRPINNVVDVTNFVMCETGQPLHAFDLRRIAQQTIIVRRAWAAEKLTTLDGQERELTPDMLVIADPEKALALAGVMGGLNSEIEADTTEVLLEAATFQAAIIRRGALSLGLRTEASARFEKGLDPNLPAVAAARALELLAQVAGASIPEGWVDRYPHPLRPWMIPFRPERINRLLGSDIPPAEMVAILQRLSFTVKMGPGATPQAPAAAAEASAVRGAGASSAAAAAGVVVVPTFRADVTREADLAEEIARFWGYDRLPETMPAGPTQPGGQSAGATLADRIRALLVSQGLSEVITYSFISPRCWDQLYLPPDHPWRRAIPIQNPLSDERSILRTCLLPGLLEVAVRNSNRQQEASWIFEIGTIFIPYELPLVRQPQERPHLGILLVGPADQASEAQDWSRRWPAADLFDLKGDLEQLFERLGAQASFEPVDGSMPFHPGRTMRLVAEGKELGIAGELHPDVLDAWELPGRTVVAELDLEQLFAVTHETRRSQPLPRFPSIRRDLALLVPTGLPAAQVVETIRQAAGLLLRSVRLFDVYEGPQVPAGHRSMAYALEFRADERTLRDEEVDGRIAEVEAALQAKNVQVRK